MIFLKSEEEIGRVRESCRLAVDTIKYLKQYVKAGTTTLQLDQLADRFIRDHSGIPSAKGYMGYPNSICCAVNETVVHGIPNRKPLKNGDILALDVAVKKGGYHGDTAFTFIVGQGSDRVKNLLDVAKQALYVGIEQTRPGNRLGDLGHAIQAFVESKGYSVVRAFCGHGIGVEFHEEPQVLHFGEPGTGQRLQEGMTLTLEPMINEGTYEVVVLQDGWTAVTADGNFSAQFEHTVAVRKHGSEILTVWDGLEEE